MKNFFYKAILSASMSACLLVMPSCEDDDYVLGEMNDASGTWSISKPTAEMTVLIDHMQADGFFSADLYNNLQAQALITEAEDGKLNIKLDNSFNTLFPYIPSTMQLQKGENFAYTEGELTQPQELNLSTPLSVEDNLPTLGSVMQTAIDGIAVQEGLPESLKNFLTGFKIIEQQIGDMKIEVNSYHFAVDLEHQASDIQGYIVMKCKIKDFGFYGADASMINMFIPMLLQNELFADMNEFNLKVTFKMNKQ